MKRFFLFFFASYLCINAYTQPSSLYDANFDTPKNVLNYDKHTQLFQNIYLQYEEAIHNLEENIRTAEKNIRQDSIQKFQEEQKKLNEEYQKLQEEFEQARTNFQQELENEQQKSQEKLDQIEKKHQEELIQVQNNFQKELKEALEKQKKDIYTKEIEQLRQNEHEKLSAELHDTISKELVQKFTGEYENKAKDLKAKFASENEQNLKNLSKKLGIEYEAKIAEFEKNKNSEMEIRIKENKRQVMEETNATTERIKIIAPYVTAIIGSILAIFLLWIILKLLIKKLHEKNAIKKGKQEKQENIQKEQEEKNRKIKAYTREYSNRLKRLKGSTIFRDEIMNIYKEIDNAQKSENEKTLRREAIALAEKEINASFKTLPIEEYRKKFNDLNPKRYFETWNISPDDIETKKALITEFSTNIAEYEKNAISALNSKNDTTEILNMLKEYVPELNSYSELLGNMKNSETDKFLKEQVSELSVKYQNLAEKFTRGKF